MSHRQDQAPVVSQGLDKATCQFYHAQPPIPRALRRASVAPDGGGDVQGDRQRRAVCLHEQHEDATLWVVRWPKQAGPVYAGTDVRVGFDRTTGQITTLLPMTFSAARRSLRPAEAGGGRSSRRRVKASLERPTPGKPDERAWQIPNRETP